MKPNFAHALMRKHAARPAAWLAGFLAAALPHAVPADGIEPFQAQTIEPDQSRAPSRQAVDRGRATVDGAFFFRTWNLYVPGTAYVVSQPAQTYDKLVVSSGTGILHRLNIYDNGSYAWATPGGVIKGRWRKGDGYPIVLTRAYEGKDWQVGFDERKGTLLVWDGSTWFEARP